MLKFDSALANLSDHLEGLSVAISATRDEFDHLLPTIEQVTGIAKDDDIAPKMKELAEAFEGVCEVSCALYSGKSGNAEVSFTLSDEETFKKFVLFLWDYLEDKGVSVSVGAELVYPDSVNLDRAIWYCTMIIESFDDYEHTLPTKDEAIRIVTRGIEEWKRGSVS